MWAQCGRNWERQIKKLKEEQRRREETGLELEVEAERGQEEERRAGPEKPAQSGDVEELPAYTPMDATTGGVNYVAVAESSQVQQHNEPRQ
jgi:hypothetical protein